MLLNPRGTALFTLFQLCNLAVAQTVDDVFQVQYNGPAACNQATVQQWYADSVTLINAAAQGVAATDVDSRQYLQTFFKVGPTDDPGDAQNRIAAVQAVVNGAGLPPGGRPWLFCNSQWLLKQSWGDVAFSRTSGLPDRNRKNVSQVFAHTPDEEAKYVPYWSSDLRKYILDIDEDDFCSDNENLGATQDIIKPSTVTLCVNNFNGPLNLANLPPVNQENVAVDRPELLVQSLTLFHEMFHLCVGCEQTPDSGYQLKKVVRLNRGQAVTNPESYTLYAFAYYLGQRFPTLTWATSSSRLRNNAQVGAPPPPRRSVEEWLKMYKPPPKSSSNGMKVWVA